MSRTVRIPAAAILLLAGALLAPVHAQPGLRNPLLEYCTGTWSENSPCAHRVIENSVLPAVRNTIVLAYHGPATGTGDPFSGFPGNTIIPLLGFTAYPSGMVDRTESPVTPDGWLAAAENQSRVAATVGVLLDKTFDTLSRELHCVFAVTPLVNLEGFYRLHVVLTENSLKYPQAGSATCPGATDYVHDHVVRAVLNGAGGSPLNTASGWGRNQRITVPLSYLVPGDVRDANCSIVAVIYKAADSQQAGEVQQALSWELQGRVVAVDVRQQEGDYLLRPSFPNPIYSAATIAFRLPRAEQVVITLYTILGEPVRVLLREERQPGEHQLRVDLSGLPAGNYFYRLQAGGFSGVSKFVIVK